MARANEVTANEDRIDAFTLGSKGPSNDKRGTGD